MAQAYGLNRHTIMNALQLLVAEGWLESYERSGYSVANTLPIQNSINTAQSQALAPKPYRFATTLTVSEPTMDLNHYAYNFAGGLPDLTRFPIKNLNAL